MSPCLSDLDLDRLHAEELPEPELLLAHQHLAACPSCSRRSEELLAEHARLLARLQDLTVEAAPPTARSTGNAPTEAYPTLTREETPPTVAAAFQDDSSSRGGLSRKDQFPGYEIVRDLGHGGQGAVYLAIQTATKSKVAIKVLRDGVHATDSTQKRFEREIQLAAQLRQHPNIITVYDSGTTADGRKFYVMDYVRGQPLTKFVRENRVPLDEALRVFGTVCDAVHFAHQRGIVHRDLKPSNILVDTDRKPRILDFGLAKALAGPSDADLSVEQGFLGTLPYLAPEQARGSLGSVDYRTDVYSLGVVLYELLTGHFPYKVTDAMASVLRRIAEEPPASPRKAWEAQSGVSGASGASGVRRRSLRGSVCPIDDEVETIVLKALAKEPERRYQSADELSRDLARYLRGESVDARRDSVLYRVRVAVRRRKRGIVWGGIAVTAVALATALAISAHLGRSAAETANRLVGEATTLLDGTPDAVRISRIDDLLDKAIRADDDCAEAYFVRGKLRVAEARSQGRNDRGKAVEKALWNFSEANRRAGGSAFAQHGAASQAAGNSTPGHRLALWSAIDLLGLTRQNDRVPELLKMLKQPGFVAAISDPNVRLARSYDPSRACDSMLLERSPDDPPLPGTRIDDSAVITRLFRADRKEPTKPLNPFQVGAPDQFVMDLVYEPLYVFSEGRRLFANPAIVERVVSPDERANRPEYTIFLRKDAKWQKGEIPITPADVVFSWQYYSRPETRSRIRVEHDKSNPSAVVITHDAPRETALLDMQFPLIPEHIFGEATRAAAAQPPQTRADLFAAAFKASGQQHVGNGAFRLESDTGNRIVLTRWDGYRGERPHVRQFVCLCSADTSTRMGILADAEIAEAELTADEFRWDFNGSDFQGKFGKLIRSRSAYDYICWNLTGRPDSPIADPDVRRAIAAAIDLDTLRRQAFDDLLPPFSGLWKFPVHDDNHPFPSDTPGDRAALAAELLDKSWKLRDSDGVRRHADGRRLRLVIACPAESLSFLRRVAAVIQQYLTPLGIEVELLERPNSDLIVSGLARRPKPEIDGLFKSVIVNEHASYDGIRWTARGERNDSGFADPLVDHDFEEAVSAGVDSSAIYRRIETAIIREQPYLFLWEKPALWAISRKLRGVTFSDLGPAQHYPGPRGWWVAQ